MGGDCGRLQWIPFPTPMTWLVPICRVTTQAETAKSRLCVKLGGLRDSFRRDSGLSVLVATIVCMCATLWSKKLLEADCPVQFADPELKFIFICCRNAARRSGRISAMNRWLLIGSMAALLVGSTGCLHHNVRSGGCASGSCSTGCDGCGDAGCNGGCEVGLLNKLGSRGSGSGEGCGGTCGSATCGSGILGRMCGLCGLCGDGCRTSGCEAGPLGWQQGGHDYSSHLNPGLLGHNAPQALNGRPFTPGAPTAQVGYPYYTVRGPRDFLVDNPPTIGR